MKSQTRFAIAGASAALLISALFTSGCEKAAATRAEPPPPKVSVAHPQMKSMVDYDSYNGWIDAAQTVEVRARVRGHIQKVHFTDGQFVKQGDLLFELDPRPFQADVDREKDQKGIYAAQLVAAQKEEARLKELLGRGGASQSQVDKAEADALSLQAQIKAADQEILRKNLDLEYSRITAPIAGRCSRAMLTEGNLVNAGGSDPVLTTIVSIDPTYLYFHVDERALQRYQRIRADEAKAAGAAQPQTVKDSKIKIQFGLESDEGFPREGTVDFADNQVDRTTGTILARAVVPNADNALIAGSRVRVRVAIGKERNVTLVPDTAILSDQDKKYVLALDEKNVVQRVDSSTARLLDNGLRVVIAPDAPARGLTAEDWIVTQGLQAARVNYPVDPVKPDGAAPATPAAPATQPGQKTASANDGK
jgi:RND family efflux transporter MFP subunit